MAAAPAATVARTNGAHRRDREMREKARDPVGRCTSRPLASGIVQMRWTPPRGVRTAWARANRLWTLALARTLMGTTSAS
eukprot:122822-Prymnesium_polylepis.1